MNFLFEIMLLVLGLCFGSFVNMLVYRTAIRYGLEKEKFKINDKNRSFCDYCGRQLRWYENIPVISWLIQRGKTSCCKKKLPLSYPAVEVIMGILFLIYGLRFMVYGSNMILWVLGLIILVLLVFSTVFDWKYMILPDFSTVILFISALVFWFIGHFGEWNYVWSALASGLFLLSLNLITKGKGMGMGDVKLAVFVGLFLGFYKTIVAFYVAFVVGAMFGIVLMIFKKAKRKTQVPFGPFIILGTLMAWWCGGEIIKFLISNF